ncbi:MAG: hypothetical protein LC657_17580 [Desulfobacteraceae bacterium]|nr:hypothetical protein [Desulfobacteraceae bacterium]
MLRFAEKKLSANGFLFHAPAFRGALFVNPATRQALLLDHRLKVFRWSIQGMTS